MISAILYVLTEGCRWRAIDQPGAKWNSIYQYYRRWCKEGVWQEAWTACSPRQEGDSVHIDSSHVKVHRSGLNPQGGCEAQSIGKTKGGWNTKLHAAVDSRGVPISLHLSPGNDADISHACEILEGVVAKTVVADKGYDSDELRIWLFERDIAPCIPAKSNRVDPLPYRKALYRKRHLVENFFAHIKTFRRVSTRYDKLAETFFGWVMLAVLIKFAV